MAEHPVDPNVRAVHIRVLRRLFRAVRVAAKDLQLDHYGSDILPVYIHRHIHGDQVE